MYQRILVPLDGSELAECVLPHVTSIVEGCRVPEVTFIRVIEPIETSVPIRLEGSTIWQQGLILEADVPKIEAELRDAANKYLDRIINQTVLGASKVQSAVIYGKAAESITEYATENKIDLVIIATHGRSGVSRWIMGSIADRVLRSAKIPIMMIRAPGT